MLWFRVKEDLMQTAAPPDSQESGSQPYPRRGFLKRGLAATIGNAALGAESLWRSEPALAYVGCECTVFVPEGISVQEACYI